MAARVVELLSKVCVRYVVPHYDFLHKFSQSRNDVKLDPFFASQNVQMPTGVPFVSDLCFFFGSSLSTSSSIFAQSSG